MQIESAEYSKQNDSAEYSQQNDSAQNILQTDSVKQNYSVEQNHSVVILPHKIATRKAETYIYGALYISPSFSGCYFWGRMRVECFCSTESFCRIILAESFCCAD